MYTSFAEQRKNIDQSTLYSYKGPFELLHTHISATISQKKKKRQGNENISRSRISAE